MEDSHRIRPCSSTDEKWLALALGPGLLGGCLLGLLFRNAVWVASSWTSGWLFVACAGTAWSWVRHRSAHLFLLVIYFAMATVLGVIGTVAWLWPR